MKKIGLLSVLLIGALVLAACGGPKRTGGEIAVNEDTGITEYYFRNDGYESVEIGTPDKPLDPAAIYASLDYIPEMFYGQYQVIGGDEAIEQYCEDMDYMDFDEGDYGIRHITKIPYQVKAGPENLHSHITDDKSHNWMEAYFMDDNGNLLFELFAYEIEGKTITLQHLDTFKYDEDTNTLTYAMDEAMTLSYEFEFKGTTLTLSEGGKSVTMNAGYIYGDEKEPHLYEDCYVETSDDMIDDIYSINFLRDDDMQYVNFVMSDEEDSRKVIYENTAKLSSDGLMTFTIPYEDGAKTYQYVYFLLRDDGLILTDGENTYRYTLSWLKYSGYGLSDVLDVNVVEGLSDAQIKKLLAEKEAILSELEAAFAAHGVSADINKDTGRVTMDTNFLFDVDSAELSADGKAYLDGFTAAYSEVILARAQEGTVAQIIVEGHTDTNGSHEYNQELSEKRAAAVSDYCIQQQPELASLIESKGYSFDQPVLDEKGEVDMDASRRVVFKFQLSVE